MMDFSLHKLFAQTMNNRLDYVKFVPQRFLLAGCDGGESRTLLLERYPGVRIDAVEDRVDFANAEEAVLKKQQKWRYKLFRKNTQLFRQSLSATLPESIYDGVWANLSLPAVADSVLSAWEKTLRPDGMLFFSTFGTDTLKEIRTLLPEYAMNALPDMHDMGDALLCAGFADAVTDMEKRTLTYRTAQCFWQDMQMLNLHAYLPQDKEIKVWIDDAILSGKLEAITLEIIYGHAVKVFRLPENESVIRFYR